jgi:hypothetical protein
MRRAGEVVSKTQILEHVWETSSSFMTTTELTDARSFAGNLSRKPWARCRDLGLTPEIVSTQHPGR